MDVGVVTGASSGIGRDVARALARRGVRTVLAARRYDRLVALADEIGRAGGEALPVACDVRRTADVERLAVLTTERFGAPDVLVNVAGYGVLRSAPDMTIDEYADVIDTNLMGAIRCTTALLPSMIRRGSGTIVNVASLASVIAIPGFSAYSASKFGLLGFSESLRHDLRPYDIHVGVVCPAAVATDFFAHDSFVRMPALMRLGMRQPADVSAAVLHAIDRRRALVTIPRLFGLVGVVRALFPGPLRATIGALFDRRYRGGRGTLPLGSRS